jgi:hypothetical protein
MLQQDAVAYSAIECSCDFARDILPFPCDTPFRQEPSLRVIGETFYRKGDADMFGAVNIATTGQFGSDAELDYFIDCVH